MIDILHGLFNWAWDRMTETRKQLEACQKARAEDEERHTETAGLLADVCDILFGDPTRALCHGYEGVLERAREIIDERDSAQYALERAKPILHAAKIPKVKSHDYEETFCDFWAELVLDESGSLDADKVKRELHDFAVCMEQCTEVYMHVTGGLLSKPNTAAEHVIAAFDERLDTDYEEEMDRLRGAISELEGCAEHLRGQLTEAIGNTEQAIEIAQELLYKNE